MKLLLLLLTAAVLFLGGMITGTHYAQTYFTDNIEHSAQTEKQENSERGDKPAKNNHLREDLIERQENLDRSSQENIFSGVGKSLDLFHPAKRGNIDND